jgi:hypothetical protein
MRWLLPLLLLSLASDAGAQLHTNPCCTVRAWEDEGPLRVWTTTSIDSARYNKQTKVLRAWADARVDSVAQKCLFEPWVVSVDPQQASLSQAGDTTFVTATVTHCGGQAAPNALMSWTARDEGVATVEQSTQLVATITAVAGGTTYIVGESDGGGADSISVTVATGCTPTATHICPGDNVASKVSAQAAGTSFTFGAGTFYNAAIVPKANMTFTGAANHGTVLDGGRIITSWTLVSGNWRASNQTQQGTVAGSGTCQDAARGYSDIWEMCQRPEQVWRDSVMLKPVATLAELTTGEFFFDYTGDFIYVKDDPTGRLMEATVTSDAFDAAVTGVTINGFVIKHYQPPLGEGVIQARGTGWTLDDNWIYDNAGAGVRVEASSTTITDNRLRKNGQYGLSITTPSGRLTGIVVERNRIDSNNTARWNPGFGAGAGKFIRTSGMVFSGNRSQWNFGQGPWWDIANEDAVITSDTSKFNQGHGYFYEISYGCHFDAVVSDSNTAGEVEDFTDGSGILISASPDCEVENSKFHGNNDGIVLLQQDRQDDGECNIVACRIANANVHNNTVVQPTAGAEIGFMGSFEAVDFHLNRNNVFEANTYTLKGAGDYFNFESASKTDAQWQTAGHDDVGGGGSITRN